MKTPSLLLLTLLCAWGACSDDSQAEEEPLPGTRSAALPATAGAATASRTSPVAGLRTLASGESGVVHLEVAGVGRIAALIQAPETPRYAEGAPVVVVVPPYFTPAEGFSTNADADQVGFVTLTLLWPGRADRRSGAESEGTDDYGGPMGMAALLALTRYGAGQLRDTDGATLDERVDAEVRSDNLGIYAFSHPGMAATKLLAEHGKELGGAVRWFVGHENPTNDALCAVEVGQWGEDKQPVLNPAYKGFGKGGLEVDYSKVGWKVDAEHPKGVPTIGKGADAYVLGDRVPSFYGKRTYSAALTRALRDSGALSASSWPADLSTPEEAAALWAERVPTGDWSKLAGAVPELHVMLVFSEKGHVLPTPDLPNIHEAWQGFHEIAGLWVRLNPDRAYVEALSPDRPLPGSEHDANTAPSDWSGAARTWGHTARGGTMARLFNAFAALGEMADRTRADTWSPDLSKVLVEGPRPTPPEPGGKGKGGRGGRGGAAPTVLTITPAGTAPASALAASGASAGSSADQPALGGLVPGPGEVLVAFGGNFEGEACTKTARSGCDLYLATYDLSASKVRQVVKAVGERALGEDFPALHLGAKALIYQVTGQGPPEIRSLDLSTGASHTLVEKAQHPVLDAAGTVLAYNREERAGRGGPKTFVVVQRSVDLSSSPPRLGSEQALTSDGKSTEPILLADGQHVAMYVKDEGPRTGAFVVRDTKTGRNTDFGAPAGCAHGSLSPSGKTLLCQSGMTLHARRVDTEPWGELQTWRYPKPPDPELAACEQITYGHPEFCGDDGHILATYSCKVGGELTFARLMVFEPGGEVQALFSEQASALLGAQGMGRSGVCSPLAP